VELSSNPQTISRGCQESSKMSKYNISTADAYVNDVSVPHYIQIATLFKNLI